MFSLSRSHLLLLQTRRLRPAMARHLPQQKQQPPSRHHQLHHLQQQERQPQFHVGGAVSHLHHHLPYSYPSSPPPPAAASAVDPLSPLPHHQFRHQSLPPPSATANISGFATLPAGFAAEVRRHSREEGEEEEDVYESIYDSRWRLMQKVRLCQSAGEGGRFQQLVGLRKRFAANLSEKNTGYFWREREGESEYVNVRALLLSPLQIYLPHRRNIGRICFSSRGKKRETVGGFPRSTELAPSSSFQCQWHSISAIEEEGRGRNVHSLGIYLTCQYVRG